MHRGQRGPQVIRIGRSPLRKAPAGRYGPARTFVAVAPCGGDLSGTCFRCSPFSDGTFIRHLRMLRDTLLSGGSLSGTCARFEAHSSAAGLHPAPAHASGHTPQRQVFIRHLRMLRGTLLSGRSSSGTCARFEAHSSADPYCRELQGGVWLPRQSTFPNVKRMRSERVETVGA